MTSVNVTRQNSSQPIVFCSLCPGDDLKLPSAKPRENYLKKYARKLGVNDRGCYIACGLAVLAFLLFIVIIAMASAWPGE